MAKAFIAYSRDDSAFALRLANDLRNAGADVWIDQLDIVPGEQWDRAVQQALQDSEAMIVVLSPASAASDNVMDEVDFARDGKKQIIPIIHRLCDIPYRLRRFQHIDLTGDYGTCLSSLLKALDVAMGPRLVEAVALKPPPGKLISSERGEGKDRPSRGTKLKYLPRSWRRLVWAVVVLIAAGIGAITLYYGIIPRSPMSQWYSPPISVSFSEMGDSTDPSYLASDTDEVINEIESHMDVFIVKIPVSGKTEPVSNDTNVNVVIGCYRSKTPPQNEVRIRVADLAGDELVETYDTTPQEWVSRIIERIRDRVLETHPPRARIRLLQGSGLEVGAMAEIEVGSLAGVRTGDEFDILDPNRLQQGAIGNLKVTSVTEEKSEVRLLSSRRDIRGGDYVERRKTGNVQDTNNP